jgi:hypothetical protein
MERRPGNLCLGGNAITVDSDIQPPVVFEWKSNAGKRPFFLQKI